MRVFVVLALLAALACNAQEPSQQAPPPPTPTYAPQDIPTPPQPSPAPESLQQATPAAPQLISVPQGTRIPLVLTTPINTHSTHPGDSVRAQTSFPVAVANQLAIPAGTYLEGQITAVHRPNSSNQPAFQMRFTRVIFANGYAVTLGATASAKLHQPRTLGPHVYALAFPESAASSPRFHTLALTNDDYDSGASNAPKLLSAAYALPGEPQQLPPPAPLPQVGPSKGLIIGLSVGVLAAVLVTTAIIAHHHHNDLYLDAGSKIDLILENSLTLDATQVANATALGNTP